MLHIDLFNSKYQKSNNEKMKYPKDTDLTLFLIFNVKYSHTMKTIYISIALLILCDPIQ